ncbi:MAG TPA: hypothetical protein DCG49_11190 [Ruminococcus sp.]|nr:hypothetical protein [Ruminococcus sp.]
MNLTLHLTEGCNMACSYCTRVQSAVRMSEDVLDAACDLAFSAGTHGGLCFFGGEPLLEQGLIERAVERCRMLSQKTGKPARFKMTTNGTLLTPGFLTLAKNVQMGIGLSFEGTAQDQCRRFQDGSGSFHIVAEHAKMLLQYLPGSYAMMTVAPDAVPQYAEAVQYLYQLGFRTILATIAYGENVHWTDDDLDLLGIQLRQIAAFYQEQLRNGTPFFFSPFDGKIRDLLRGFQTGERCHLGFRQMPVAPDGKIYACTQFIGDADFCLGDVFSGINTEKQKELAMRDATPDTCKACALRSRCTNSCGCLNRLETGNERTVSPLQCAYERMLIGIADETADALFQADPARFQKRFSS